MRRGFAITEVIVSVGLVAVLLAVTVQTLSLMAVQRRNLDRRAIALQEAANLVERVSLLGYDKLSEETLSRIELAPEVQKVLPGVESSIQLAAEPGEVPGKRVRVEITWNGKAGREPPVQLTHWFWQGAGGGAR